MKNTLKIAKYYFDLSNEGNLEKISELFTCSSTYSSANTGMYLGVDQIMKMQREFFSSFETMGWKVHSYEEVSPGIVLFDFTFSGKTLEGEEVHRDGLEYVIIFKEKIQHVEVRNK